MLHRATFILEVFVLLGCTTASKPKPQWQDVRAALAERYPATTIIHGRGLQFEAKTSVERVELSAMAKALPDVRFYMTELRTGNYEYPQVSVAVAVPRQGPIAVYLSPTYDDADDTLIDMLKQARVANMSEERSVAEEIATLFAKITYEGRIEYAQYVPGHFSAELWHSQLLWRRVSITFVNGHVFSVSLDNPKSL